MKIEIPNKLLGALALGGACFAAGIGIAAEFPETDGALVYSGLITDDMGIPRDTSQAIVVTLYTAASGGSAICTATEPVVDLNETQGRFAVALPDICADAIADAGDAWAQVKVGNITLPRQKLGAVPFALVAREAQTASVAEVALEAQTVVDGLIDDAQLAPALRTRIEALETAVDRTIVIASISASQSIPRDGTAVNWNAETLDSHQALNGTTFTAPASGPYHICAQVNYFEIAQWPLAADIWVAVFVDRIAGGEEYHQVASRRQQQDWYGRLNIIGGCLSIVLAASESIWITTGQTNHDDARPILPHSTSLTIIGL